MTPTAAFADWVIPARLDLERADVARDQRGVRDRQGQRPPHVGAGRGLVEGERAEGAAAPGEGSGEAEGAERAQERRAPAMLPRDLDQQAQEQGDEEHRIRPPGAGGTRT